MMVAYVDDLVIAGKKAQVDISWKQLNQILAFGAPPALIERFLGCRHTFTKMKSGAYQLEWDVEDMIRKAVEDFCQQRKTSVDKLKKAISPTLSELDKPPQDPDSSQLKRTAGPIARVLYIARAARPDVAYAVSRLARRATRWTEPCERELVRLIGYLNTTSKDRLSTQVMPVNLASLYIDIFSDADLAGDRYSARSTSGIFISLVGTDHDHPEKENYRVPLIWQSRMQTSVADSTAEAELTAAHAAVKLAEPYRVILSSLLGRPIGVKLSTDNAAAMAIIQGGEEAQSMAHAKRTQRINIRWLQEALGYVDEEGFGTIVSSNNIPVATLRKTLAQGGAIIVLVKTDDQRADIFTKPLPPNKFSPAKHLVLMRNG